MADTIRQIVTLLTTLFQDGQSAGSILPQDARDLIVSLASRSTVSIQQFGASPGASGATNSAAFGTAIAAGGNIYVPAGTYILATALLLNSSTYLFGDGPGLTVLQSTDSTNHGVVFHHGGAAVTDFALSDMTLTTALVGGNFDGPGLIYFDRASITRGVISRVKFTCPSIGINGITGQWGAFGLLCQDLTVQDCNFDTVGRMGCELLNQDKNWAATTAFSLNDIIIPVVPRTALDFRVTTAGTSAASEPTWPSVAGGTVTSGTVVFTAVVPQYNIQNAKVLRNTFRNVGNTGTGSAYGYSISGRAIACLTADNLFDGISLGDSCENAGASYSIYRGNRFINFNTSGSVYALSVSDNANGGIFGTIYDANIFVGAGAPGAAGGQPVRMSDCVRSRFTNNYVEAAVAAQFAGCTDIDVDSNTFNLTDDFPIGFDGTNDSRFTNNIVVNTRAGAGLNSGPIVFFNASNGNTMTGNTWRLATGGVNTPVNSDTAANNSFGNNNFIDNGTTLTRMNGDYTFSGAIDFPSIATGASNTQTATVTGAAIGDYVAVLTCSITLSGLALSAAVTAVNTVSITAVNGTGGAVNLASATFKVAVNKIWF